MNKSPSNSVYKKVLLVFFMALLAVFLIRFLNPRELDDVAPEMACEPNLLEKADVLWVIPDYNNFSISNDEEWCSYILSLNKTLGMHGVRHEYEEFGIDRQQKYLEDGMKTFSSCFGFNPTMFKPPQLKISSENKKLVKSNGMKLKDRVNQITHKVYHCNDSGEVKNWVIDLF